MSVSGSPPWLDVPHGWGHQRIKHLGHFFGGGTPSKENQAYWAGDIPWVSPKDMKHDLVSDTEDHITRAAVRESATQLVPAGSMLVVVRSGILQHTIPTAINLREVALNQDMKAFVASVGFSVRFLRYLLDGFQDSFLLAWRKEGATVESLDFDLLGNTLIAFPTGPRQDTIVSFLDRKTAAIDALVAKKERLIELLQEKRQALITQAVTKGLDPSVPMKESGLVWMGAIPRHWALKRLKHLTSHVTVGIVITPSKYYVDKGVPCPRSFNVRPGRIDERDLAFISPESNRLLSKSIIREGDLVAVRTGQPGTTAVVSKAFDGGNCIDLIIVRRSAKFDSEYLCRFMNSALAFGAREKWSTSARQEWTRA